jgi:hypothetical protein
MFKNKKSEILFGILVSILMAIGMELYNLSLNNGGLSSWMFTYIWNIKEVPMMSIIVFIMEHFIACPIVNKKCKNLINNNDNKLIIILIRTGLTVMIMCPIMSLWATILFKKPNINTGIVIYLQTLFFNLPVALLWQTFFVGPLARKLFNKEIVI